MFEHVFTGIPVRARDGALDWYERFAGRPPDLVPNDDEAAWQLTANGWIYILADIDRAGSALNTLLVDDLDGLIAELEARGVHASHRETMDNEVRFAIFADGDGNRLKVAQPPATDSE